MKRVFESPFLDEHAFEREREQPWEPDSPGLVSESPFLDAFSVAEESPYPAEEADSASIGEEESTAWQEDYAEGEQGAVDAWQEAEAENLPDIGDEAEFEDEYVERDPSAAEVDGVDPASNEYEAIDPAGNEYPSTLDFPAAELDAGVDPAAAELDTELFQRLVPLGAVVERTLLAGQIAMGKRDQSALTDFVFFFRHPELKGTRLGKGQEALMAEWLQIRDQLVRPALSRVATPADGGSAAGADVGSAALGTLVCNVPGRQPFSYKFTPDDLVWTARFINGEAGGRDDAQNRSIIWAMFNRYAFFRNSYPSWGSFGDFIRKYSTPLQPYLKTYEQVKSWAAKCNATFNNEGCNYQPTTTEVYPGTTLRKGQLKTFLKLQQTPWTALKETSRRLAVQALSGQVENPIGNASEFGDTAVYYRRKHGVKPTREQWEKYTREYAAKKGWLWRPAQTPYDEYGNNVLFINGAATKFPPNATRIVRAGASAPSPAVAPTPTRPTALPTPQGDPSRELVYDGTRPAPGTTETRRSYATNPPVKGDPSNRSRMLYDNVINQFAAGVNPRYKQKYTNGKMTSTYCNIFCWDVTRAMGAEIPHWVNRNGDRMERSKDANEMNANATYDWLHKHGSRYGWRRLANDAEAQAHANEGRPVIATMKKSGGIGHVSVVRPGDLTDKGPPIAQAGRSNFNFGRLYSIFRRGGGVELWGAA